MASDAVQLPAMSNLSNKSISAVFWGTGGAVARLTLQFAAQVVLARILGPEQYGVFAIGAIVISFSNFFADVGLAYGLIQKNDVSECDIRFVFTWQIILGSCVAAAVFFSADMIAAFFGDQRATDVVRVLASICLLNALAAPSLNLLKRALDFRRIQIAQVGGFLAGYVAVGIPLAMFGFEVWALVFAWIIQSLVVLLVAYRATAHPVSPLVTHGGYKDLVSYGALVLITNLTNWVIMNIDRVIIGRAFSSRDIGLYATTYNMLSTPTTSILGVIQPVFFSASSRLADNQQAILATYRALIAAITTYLMPAFFTIAVVSSTFIEALYGPKWSEAATILPPIALAMPLFLIWGLTTPLLWAGGHASREFRTQLPIAVLWLAACWVAAQQSVAAVAWTVLGLYIFRCAILIGTACRHLTIPVGSVISSVGGGLGVSVIVAVTVGILDAAMRNIDAHLRLITDIAAGGVSMLFVLRAFPRLISLELANLNARLIVRLPARVAATLSFLVRR